MKPESIRPVVSGMRTGLLFGTTFLLVSLTARIAAWKAALGAALKRGYCFSP